MKVIQHRNNTEQGDEFTGWKPVPHESVVDSQPVIMVIGCGRWSMGDDQAGLATADMLRSRWLPNVTISLSEQPILDLTDEQIGGVGLLIVIDTALADEHRPAGSFQRIDYRDGVRIRQEAVRIDTHSLDVSSALQLADNLGLLPHQVWIYALFGSDFDRELRMSSVVEAAIPSLVELIEKDITAWTGSPTCTNSP